MDPAKARAFLYQAALKGIPYEPDTLGSDERSVEIARRIFDRMLVEMMPLPESVH